MFLSLFLLLLAFFILLNSISSFRETKSRAVLSSVASTFQAETTSDLSAEIVVSTLGPVPEPMDVINEVERLWLTAVPITRVEKLVAGNTLMMDVPTTQIFVGAEPTVRSDRGDLIEATASALAANLNGLVTEVQAVIFVDGFAPETVDEGPAAEAGPAAGAIVDLDDPDASILPTSTLEGLELASVRQERLSQAFVNAGAPPGNVQVGLRKGRVGRIKLRFFIRDDSLARLTFSNRVGAILGGGAGAGQ